MILRLLGLSLLAKVVDGTRGEPIPVDFYVFKGKDGDEKNVVPRTSMNINPPDDVTGLFAKCKDSCPWFNTSCGANCLSPQMRWCRCVAELLAKDLAVDFRTLLDAKASPVFTLGDYVEMSAGQELFDVKDGHTTLYSLMEADSSHPYARRSGRVAVWVASHVAYKDDPNSFLAGTTLLDQPLWSGGKGAGVLINARNDRSSKILSHEVGHIVGFHHTAGPSLMYKYDHAECPSEYRHVESHPLVFPSCQVNIMGHWYDGPYCCPFPSFLLQLRAGRSSRKQCLENKFPHVHEAHCCGKECVHECPKKMPEPTFATKEHQVILTKMLKCWLHLRTVPATKTKSPNGTRQLDMLELRKSSIQCFDYDRKMGSCKPYVKTVGQVRT